MEILPKSLVTSELSPEDALRVWTWLNASKCGKALRPGQRLWLELFAAVSMRDAEHMAGTGAVLLESTKGSRSEPTEYAFLATVSGLVCTAGSARARELIDSSWNWLRSGMRPIELRYLGALAGREGLRCPAAKT